MVAKYKREKGDSSQKCPCCGANWAWSSRRRLEMYHYKRITLNCKCKRVWKVSWNGENYVYSSVEKK